MSSEFEKTVAASFGEREFYTEDGYCIYSRDALEIFIELRKLWEAEQDHIVDANKMVPIAGPPDLEGVPDYALFVLGRHIKNWLYPEWENMTSIRYAAQLRKLDYRKIGKEFIWHIPLGVITPPELEMPKCPVCGKSDCCIDGNQDWEQCWTFLKCQYCGWQSEWKKTEAEAIADAK